MYWGFIVFTSNVYWISMLIKSYLSSCMLYQYITITKIRYRSIANRHWSIYMYKLYKAHFTLYNTNKLMTFLEQKSWAFVDLFHLTLTWNVLKHHYHTHNLHAVIRVTHDISIFYWKYSIVYIFISYCCFRNSWQTNLKSVTV